MLATGGVEDFDRSLAGTVPESIPPLERSSGTAILVIPK